MLGYIGRRLVQTVFTLIGVTFLTFLLLTVVPADPAQVILGHGHATPEQIANVRQQLGLNLPIHERYLRYLGNLLQGDLGRSYEQKSQVTELIVSRLPATFTLVAGAIFFEILIGVSLGLIAATRRDRLLDRVIMVSSFALVSAPQFVVGILLLYVFGVWLGWLPMSGYGGLSHLILPALTLGVLGAGWYARIMRSSLIDVLRQDFMRTAKAKGLRPASITFVHAVPNAILPIVALIGSDVGYFMSQTVVVESVYGWPGIGQLAWQAIQRVDIPIIMGVTLVSAVAIVLGNLIADLVAPLIDPRIKLR